MQRNAACGRIAKPVLSQGKVALTRFPLARSVFRAAILRIGPISLLA